MINIPNFPVAAEPGVYDTKKVYGDKNVSFGEKYSDSYSIKGMKVEFKTNCLKREKSVDERNLIQCEELSLRYSSIENLETFFLT